jgi:hypothetical protein
MEIKNYLTNLMPRLKRSELNEAIDKVDAELNQTVIPQYEEAAELFGERKFKSKWVAGFDDHFKKEFELKYKGNYISAIQTTLVLVNDNLQAIKRLANTVEGSWSKDAVSLLCINLTRSVDLLKFITMYARRLLGVTLRMETNVAESRNEFADIQKNEYQWLEINRSMFLKAYAILAMKKGDLERRMKEVPNVTVGEENVEMVVGNVGERAADPLGLGLIPLAINPFYHIGRFVAEKQANYYHAAIAEKDAIEMRLVYLRQIERDGKGDAILGEEIEIAQSRVDKLNYKIMEMEEKWLD